MSETNEYDKATIDAQHIKLVRLQAELATWRNRYIRLRRAVRLVGGQRIVPRELLVQHLGKRDELEHKEMGTIASDMMRALGREGVLAFQAREVDEGSQVTGLLWVADHGAIAMLDAEVPAQLNENVEVGKPEEKTDGDEVPAEG